MKTKFILHGGCTSYENESNDNFFREVVKDLDDGATVLYVGFARQTEAEQQEVFERDSKELTLATNKRIVVEKASMETFVDQLARAAAIFTTGGTSKVLKERLRQFPEFKTLLAGKTYAGSSAGANAMAAYHTSADTEGALAGLGIIPVCVMGHYGNPEYNGIEEHEWWFDEVRGDMELIRLPECQWVVREYEL